MKKNVLVFPCGSEIGLEAYRSLYASTHVNLIGGSSVDDHGKFVYKNYLGDLPFVNDPNFTAKVNEVVVSHNIDIILPAHDDVLLKLAHERKLGNLKCEVMTSVYETCEITRSKLKTYQHFKDIIPVPHIFESVEDVTETDWPVFLKPDIGQGSKGTHLTKDPEEASFYIAQDPSLLILECLTGKEYTVDCFTNRHGELLFCEGRERRRVLNGISVNSQTIEDSLFAELAAKINTTLSLRGVWFFQVKENKAGELVLLEIASRIAGTMGATRAKGVNMALLSLFDFWDVDVSITENKYEMIIDRALENTFQHNLNYDHVYLDLDDLVILEGSVNPSVMAFVYQCVNKKIRLHLLTRHKENLENTLANHRLSTVFDEVIWVQNGEPKSDYVKEKNAIFVDDSFAERQEVAQACNIPVFDGHMIESLMEKF